MIDDDDRHVSSFIQYCYLIGIEGTFEMIALQKKTLPSITVAKSIFASGNRFFEAEFS